MKFLKSSITTIADHGVLNSVRVLVTRPLAQGQVLADKIRSAGGGTLLLPLIELRKLAESQVSKSIVLELDRYQKIIFVSRPAARLGCELMDRYWPQLPIGINWFAIGQGTAQELKHYDIDACYAGLGTDSEALLELDDFANVKGERILLVKGVGGRDHLKTRLGCRGAEVTELAVYERYSLDYAPEKFAESLLHHNINVAVVTSGMIAERLDSLLAPPQCASLHLVVPSVRVAEALSNKQYASIMVSDGAGDSAILESLQQLTAEIGVNRS